MSFSSYIAVVYLLWKRDFQPLIRCLTAAKWTAIHYDAIKFDKVAGREEKKMARYTCSKSFKNCSCSAMRCKSLAIHGNWTKRMRLLALKAYACSLLRLTFSTGSASFSSRPICLRTDESIHIIEYASAYRIPFYKQKKSSLHFICLRLLICTFIFT